LVEEFNKKGYNIKEKKTSIIPVKLISIFKEKTKTMMPYLGRELVIDNDKSIKILKTQLY